MREDLVVMLTALNLEYEAVRRELADPRVHRHERGTLFEVATVPGTSCRVALALTNKGNHPAAVLAERAIQEFSPVAVMFVGVAGALWDTTSLGDVVVATHVYAYHGGTSEDDGLKARPRAWETAHGISQLATHLARTGNWADPGATGHGQPTVHFGAIAAGEIVQNSRISSEAHWIRQHYNDALAIEMEAAGVAQAGHLNGSPVAIVRGISDLADGAKTTGQDRDWQPRAAANAAAFAIRLATELVQEEHTAMRNDDNTQHGGIVYNIAQGSTVGAQAGSVTGNINMNTAPKVRSLADLAAELDALRTALQRARAAGALDDAAHEAAQAELEIASRVVQDDTPESSRKFVLALKRLRGLVADLADLSAKLAPLIIAAGELSQ